MSAATGYLIKAVGWQMTFVIEGIPSVLVGLRLALRRARSPRAGLVAQSRFASEHLERRARPRTAQPYPRPRTSSTALRLPSVLSALRPVLLLEPRHLWLYPVAADDHPRGHDSGHRDSRPLKRRSLLARSHSDAAGRPRLRPRAGPQALRLAIPGARGTRHVRLLCIGLSQLLDRVWIPHPRRWLHVRTIRSILGDLPEMLPKNVAGEVLALVNSCGALGAFAGSWMVGWLQAVTGNSQAGFLLMSAALVVSGAIIFFLRPANQLLRSQD
jgi:hypothetical protein